MRTSEAPLGPARIRPRVPWARLGPAALALAVACSGGGGGGGAAGGGGAYALSGTLVSMVTGAPVAGATVTLSGDAAASSRSDADGGYRFTGLGNGSYLLTPAIANGAFRPSSRTAQVQGGSLPGLDFAAAQAAVVAGGIPFLPATFLSSDQLRASLVVRDGYAHFTSSGAAPLQRAPLGGGDPETLAIRFTGAKKLALAGQDVFWVDQDRLCRTPLAGGPTTVLAAGSPDHGTGVTADLAVDGAFVYWANSVGTPECSPPCRFVIQKVPAAGGDPVTLATAGRMVSALAMDADRVYWEEASLDPVTPGCECGSSIKSVPKAGGPVTLIVDNRLNGAMAPPPEHQVPASWYPTGGLALSGPEILFGIVGFQSYQLAAAPVAGGPVRTVATVAAPDGAGTGTVLGPVLAGGAACWLDHNPPQTLYSAPVAGGTATPLAAGLGIPADPNFQVGLAADGGYLYWTEPLAPQGCCFAAAAGRIRQLPLAGGQPATVLAGLDAPGALAAAGGRMAWADRWRVGAAGTDGGAAATLASGIAANLAPIAVDAANVYILDGDFIKQVPRAGGTLTVLAPARFGSLNDLSWVDQAIAADGAWVYWTVQGVAGGTTVQKVPAAGGAPATLAVDASWAPADGCRWRLLADGRNVYWNSGGSDPGLGGAVRTVPSAGGAVTTLVDCPVLLDFALDASHLYFAEAQYRTIQRVPLGGGAPVLFQGNTLGWVLGGDADRLYWITPYGDVLMAPKAGTGTAATWLPGTLQVDYLLALESLGSDAAGLYLTETRTGTIYRAF